MKRCCFLHDWGVSSLSRTGTLTKRRSFTYTPILSCNTYIYKHTHTISYTHWDGRHRQHTTTTTTESAEIGPFDRCVCVCDGMTMTKSLSSRKVIQCRAWLCSFSRCIYIYGVYVCVCVVYISADMNIYLYSLHWSYIYISIHTHSNDSFTCFLPLDSKKKSESKFFRSHLSTCVINVIEM